MSDVDLRFLPWCRRGAATLIDTPDGPSAPARFSGSVSAQLVGVADPITAQVTLLGPGDVQGLGEEQILRREPERGAVGYEPNHLPHLDLVDADLPWRFTPAREVSGRLRPWLVLIALEQTETLQINKTGRAPAPFILAPVAELPDLSESALWAHVQVSGPFDATPLTQVLRDQPERAQARLLCARRLRPNRRYLLCVVPAFEVGRVAGLGEDLGGAQVPDVLEPAWSYDPSSAGHRALPVYHHWSFSTGAEGDFESLARALSPHTLDAAEARRTFALDALIEGESGETLPLQGALRPVLSTEPPAEAPSSAAVSTLTGWLNRAADVEDNGVTPQVCPPIYGRLHAGVRRVAQPNTPEWLDELNLDPRHRIAAAAGGDVVQQHQDEFMDQAWAQAGQLAEVNAALAGAQLARSLGQGLRRRHLQDLPDDLMLQVAGPGQGSTAFSTSAQGVMTLLGTVESSAVPEMGFSGAFRRLSRVRGPHMRGHAGAHPVDADPNAVLFQQGFVDEEVTNWEAVDATYAVMGPSNWSWSTDGSTLTQTSNIYVPETATGETAISKRGTVYLGGSLTGRDLRFSFTIVPSDNDAVGVVFRYQSDRYYYRFSMDSERQYRRLDRFYAGGVATVWSDTVAYTPGAAYDVVVTLEGDRIVIELGPEGGPLQTLVTFTDSTLSYGRVGFYSWGSAGTTIRNVRYRPRVGLGTADLAARITDEGDVAAPSAWALDAGALIQTRNIYSLPTERESLDKRGTFLELGDSAWRDYALEATLRATDDDAVGLMFRVVDADNFYRFSTDLQRSYMRLVRCVGGVFSLLWQLDEGCDLSTDAHRFRIVADGSRLRGYLEVDGGSPRRLFDLRDRAHAQGGVGLYCWGNDAARFEDIVVSELRPRGLMARLNDGELGIPVPPGGGLDLALMGQLFLAGTDAAVTVPARVAERLSVLPEQTSDRDELEPLVLGPELNTPLSNRLIAMAPHLVLPGLEAVPDSAVMMLETNEAFVAAFMVGANHEMQRELRWRGLDSDQRATVFRQFWDVRGGAQATDSEALRDISPIHAWSDQGSLASFAGADGAHQRTIILIRSELIRRFPEASYFLVRAIDNGQGGRRPGADTEPYAFRGQLTEDMAFFGFDLDPADVRGSDQGGDLGWYLTLEQPPIGSRFGLDQGGAPGETLSAWSELGWGHLDDGETLLTSQLNATPPTGTGLPSWGESGAHMAAITLRKPVRLFIHARRLLASPPTTPEG